MPGLVDIETGALDVLMPMHLLVEADGTIGHAGPSLAKLARQVPLAGRPVFECLEARRPSGLADLEGLLRAAGATLNLSLRAHRRIALRGVAMPRPAGLGAIVNLSLGLGELEDLGEGGLTCTDFAATDKTVDMLYLIEAKSAAMAESRKLIGRLQGARIAAEEQAFTDTLTGLKNRRALDHILGRSLAAREGFALMQADLDYFKRVNDTLGHAAGDCVLQAVAHVLIGATRAEDTVARVGGDEFVILLHGLTDPERIDRIARRMIARFETPILYQGVPCHVSASLGSTISTFYDRPDPVRMGADADLALYASKAAGRARHRIWSPGMGAGKPPPERRTG